MIISVGLYSDEESQLADLLVTDIDDAIWERFKAKAALANKSEQQLALELIDVYLRDCRSEIQAESDIGPTESATIA